jgi:hypothetical protein
MAIGQNAGGDLTDGGGSGNVFLGANAGSSVTTGDDNTYVGNKAAGNNAEGSFNVVMGKDAGNDADGDYNNTTIIGWGAGKNLTDGSGNLFFGYLAGPDLTSGDDNVLFLGGANITTGNRNIGIGLNSIGRITNHNNNIGIGVQAGRYILGSDNVAIGQLAGRGDNSSAVGSDNTSIGRGAGLGVDGSRNIFIGNQAAYDKLTPADDMLVIDNRDQGSGAAVLTDAIIVGYMHNTPASQILIINADLAITYDLDHNGSNVGFYGTSPITQAVLATGVGATVDNVITALQNLGLVKQS